MTARLKGRRREVGALLGRVIPWASGRPDIRALALVGSYAYGRPRMGSDVDLLLGALAHACGIRPATAG